MVGDKLCWAAGQKRPDAHLLISLSTIPITHGPRWDSGGAKVGPLHSTEPDRSWCWGQQRSQDHGVATAGQGLVYPHEVCEPGQLISPV